MRTTFSQRQQNVFRRAPCQDPHLEVPYQPANRAGTMKGPGNPWLHERIGASAATVGARDLLCPKHGARICPRGLRLAAARCCKYATHWFQLCSAIKFSAPIAGSSVRKIWAGADPNTPGNNWSRLVLRSEAFSLHVVRCCVLVRTGNALKRGVSVIGPVLLVTG